MARASWEATAAACAAAPASPARRPFCVTRAASPGAQRYASSWTGDNASSWHSLRWGLSAVLQLSLSGLFFVGADVGGFSGPPPPPELLVRWFQAGCLHPRFVTNSWKACGSVTSPLLHPASVALCVAAIRLRLRLMPYLYSLCAAAAERGEPIVRPPFWDFGAADPACFAAAGHARPDGAPACFMLGPSLLAAPAVDPGARSVTLRLPAGPAAWYDWYSEESLAAGAVATLGAPLDRLPLACPAGAMLPLTQPSSPSPTNSGGCTAPPPAVAPHDEPTRHLRVFPFPASGASAFTLVEDDGETAGGPGRRLRFALTCTPHEVAVTLEVEHVAGTAGGGDYALPYDEVVVSLPAAERRPLRLAGPAGGPRLVRGRFAHEPL